MDGAGDQAGGDARLRLILAAIDERAPGGAGLATAGIMQRAPSSLRDDNTLVQLELERILSEFGAETGTVHVLDGDSLVLRAHVGLPATVAAIVATVPIGKGMAGLAAELNAPVDSCNIQTDATGNVRPGAKATGVGGGICVPIRGMNRVVRGTLGIGVPHPHEYSVQERERLMSAAVKLLPYL